MLRGQLGHHIPCTLGVQASTVSSRLETKEDSSFQSRKMLLSMNKCLHGVATPHSLAQFGLFLVLREQAPKGVTFNVASQAQLGGNGRFLHSEIQTRPHHVWVEFLTTAFLMLATSISCGCQNGRRPRLVKKQIPNQRRKSGTTFFGMQRI